MDAHVRECWIPYRAEVVPFQDSLCRRMSHLPLGRDDLVRNAYLVEEPRSGDPVVRAWPASPWQRRDDARHTVVTDGMVRSSEQRCDL
jgi:hypothetical protein